MIDTFDDGKEDLIIFQWLLEERNVFTTRVPLSSSNEHFTKSFIIKLTCFSNEKCKLAITVVSFRGEIVLVTRIV